MNKYLAALLLTITTSIVSVAQINDFELMRQALEYKQNRYDSNTQRIQNKIDYIYSLFEYFWENSDQREIAIRSQEINRLYKLYSNNVDKIVGVRLDLSSTAKTNQIINSFNHFESELIYISKEVERERKSTVNRMRQIKSLYNSYSNYPSMVKDGWHSVYSMNNGDFCEERKVYVQNNKVTKYMIDDWDEVDIQYSTRILKAKVRIMLVDREDLLDIYFLDLLDSSN